MRSSFVLLHPHPLFPAAGITTIALLLSGCDRIAEDAEKSSAYDASPSVFVGAEACAGCHEKEYADWQGSHHELAMREANEDAVLGDFDDSEFRHFDVSSRFFRRDGKFWVRTDNAKGDLQDFEIKYTFGVTPLQQYLVEFPDGRLQTLATSWDTRPREEGGQRWFHIYDDEYIGHTDPLHWTGREQNWNYMCAECHSTGLDKNYQISTDTFNSKWAEINVACEACHGPGSRHVVDTEAGFDVNLNDTAGAFWQMNAATGSAQRSQDRASPQIQPEACGRCHSRRGVITADYEFGRPLTDTHLPSLLDENLYYADGQIQDEVYVYGSFLQSKMYRAGVTCSDCHDPHTAGLKTTGEVSEVCAGCHLPGKFASSDHHRHEPADVECVDCHMPSRTYMVVDQRRDHSLRVPSPELTIRTGSPNACTQCHSDGGARWAADAVEAWYGKPADETAHHAEAIHAGRLERPGANAALVDVIDDDGNSGIVRATALAILAAPFADDAAAAIKREMSSSDPLIRIGALRALQGISPEFRAQWAAPLLRDPIRAVRIQAVSALSPARATLRQSDQESFNAAELEYTGAQMAIAERPESHINLGNLYLERGDAAGAEQSYLVALRMEPHAVAARANLADLYRQLGRDSEAEQLLRDGLALDEESAALHHALGLTLVRGEKQATALVELARAAELDSGNARYAYVFGVAINSLGEPKRAIAVLENAHKTFPADYDIAWALATMYRDAGRAADARAMAAGLLRQFPNDQNTRLLLDSL